MSQTISPLGVTQNFTYDAFNRLWTASEGDWAQTYAYDAMGNRAVVAGSYIPTSAATPQVPSAGSPLPYSNNQWSGASYDAAGNIIAQNGTSFTYDAENRQ